MSTKFYNLKQQISNTPEIDEAISEKGIKDYADKVGVPFAVPTCTAGSGSSPYLSVKWDLANIAGTTTPYDGMKICIRPDTTGVSTAGVILSIDGGTTYHPVVYGTNTAITSTYLTANTPIVLVYNATQTANGYATSGTATTYTGVWQMNYKFTTYMYRLSHNYGTYITKTDLKRYKLLVQYDETTMLPISSGSSTSGHTIDTTNTFNPFGQICYLNSSTTNYKSAGAAIGASALAQMYLVDLRYTFNGITTSASTSAIEANKDLYLVAEPQSDGTAKIASTPLSQTLPSTEDNKIYIYLGHTSSVYQVELHVGHPIYYYKSGCIRQWVNAATGTDSDQNVKKNYTNQNIDYNVLLATKNLSSSDTGIIDESSYNDRLTYNPSTGTLSATNFLGDGSRLTNLPASGVQSITAGTGLSGGTITGSGTIAHNDIETTTAVSTAALVKVTTDGIGHIKTTAAAGASDITGALGYTPYNSTNPNGYTTNTGTVTSVQVQATSPVQSSTSTASSTTLNTTISLASAYGDTQNPYGSKTANTVLAAPNGSAGTPSFRALVPADLPDVTVTMTLTSGSNRTYTVSNASHTPTEVVTALTAGKSVIIKATIDSVYDVYFQPSMTVTSMMLLFYGVLSFVGTSIMQVLSDLTQTTPTWSAGTTQLSILTTHSTIGTGDSIVVQPDSSLGGGVAPSSISFDTSNTTQYLRADGTWATPSGGGGGDTGYTYEALATNASTVSFGSSKGYKAVAVTGSTQTFNIAVSNTCTNYLLVENTGSGDCAVAIGVQSGTSFTSVVKPSAGITVASGKAVELSFMSINSGTRLVVTVSAEMEIDTLT